MDKNAIIKALRNGTQSASNAVATSVTAPVDFAAEGLRAVGLPIPNDHVMGSQWARNRGLTAPVEPGLSADIGEAVGTGMTLLPMDYKMLAKMLVNPKDMAR